MTRSTSGLIAVVLMPMLTSSTVQGLSAATVTGSQSDGSTTESGPSLTPDRVEGIGALGQIEPRSRVIRVSHNAGPEGVKLQTLYFNEGDQVKQGERLAVLSDYPKREAELAAIKAHRATLQAQLAAETITRDFNGKEYRRFETLKNNAAVSKSVADQKKLAFDQSNMAIKQLQAQLNGNRVDQQVAEQILANTFITAPLDGTIIKIHARPGEKIGDNGLLEMADLTALDVVAEVYESDLPRVRPGSSAEIRLSGYSRPFNATVREIGFMVKKNDLNDTDPLADRDNRVIEVRLTLEQSAVEALQHQIYRQVQVRILP